MKITVLSPTKSVKCTDFLHKSVVDDSSEKVETLDSVKTGDLMEHDRHCKLHAC